VTGPRPTTNTHVHVPPNFSAFEDVEDVVDTARREGLRLLGISNFHDLRVYRRFAERTRAAEIVALFGSEYITVVSSLRDDGIRVNDPANPGRLYLCGKGVDPFREPSAVATAIDAPVRAANRARAARMTELLAALFDGAGLATHLDHEAIVGDVASRAGVPADWVVLQERHLAMAFQEALFAAGGEPERAAVLERVYGGPAKAPLHDPAAVQGELRSRLLKAGCPAFADETALTFDDAYRLVLEWDGIPCYPTLADGASPICEFEADPARLAERLVEMGINAAELIPMRNAPEVAAAYIRTFRAAGMIVTAGTEHNTPERIPLEPRAKGGAPLPDDVLATLYEGACAVAGHQAERAAGRAGFVDAAGKPGPGPREAWISRFAAIGAALIEHRSPAA